MYSARYEHPFQRTSCQHPRDVKVPSPIGATTYLTCDDVRGERGVRAMRSGRTGHKALGAAAVAITITVFSFASTLVKLADTPAVLVAFWRMVITAIVWNAIAFDHRAWLALHRDADVDDRRARPRADGVRPEHDPDRPDRYRPDRPTGARRAVVVPVAGRDLSRAAGDRDGGRARRAAGIRTAEPTRGLQTGPSPSPCLPPRTSRRQRREPIGLVSRRGDARR